ncbi:MAG: NAD-dependent epimerase/dehydratase family protein [Bacteroidia bacterium]
MSKILITGGAGFIGSNLSIALVNRGHEVVVLDTLSPQIHGEQPEQSVLFNTIKNKVKFIRGSVTDIAKLKEALTGVDVVVHFAAETGTGQSMYEIQRYVDVNIGGTAKLLDILVNQPHHVKKVVIASSRSIYGEGRYQSKKYGTVYPTHRNDNDLQQGKFDVSFADDVDLELLATTEDSKIHPSSVYGITKQNQEQMVMTVCPTVGIAPVTLRYQNVYGPGQSLSNPYTGILSIFSTQIRNNMAISIFEDGKESRDFVFIDDVVKATVLAIEREEANGQIFNVGSGMATSVLTVAQTLIAKLGIDVDVKITGNYRLGDIRHNIADLTHIKNVLGFEPEFDFDRGITLFAKWVTQQDIKNNNYERSIEEMKVRGLYK